MGGRSAVSQSRRDASVECGSDRIRAVAPYEGLDELAPAVAFMDEASRRWTMPTIARCRSGSFGRANGTKRHTRVPAITWRPPTPSPD